MRFCVSLLSLCLLLAACSESTGPHGFTISDAQVDQGRNGLQVRLKQQLLLSPEAVEALENGVPLNITLHTEVRANDTLALVADQIDNYEIRYLPLSQHYQLSSSNPESVRTFPRLRHVTNALSSLQVPLVDLPLTPGRYTLRSRTYLNHSGLPAPMQLPAALSGQWHHDSEWSQWQFRINA